MILTLRLPKSCNPNGSRGGHWGVKSRARKTERRMAKFEALRALGTTPAPRWPAGTLAFTWFVRHPTHVLDEGNAVARMKPYLDGLVDAGIFADDKDVKHDYFPIVDPKGKPRVLLDARGPNSEVS